MKQNKVWTVPLALLALALLTAPSLLRAQTGSVTGVITDVGTLAPLDAVQVSIVGQGIGVATNAEGRYLIPGVPVGEVTIQAGRLGYATQTVVVTVTADAASVADFALESEALLLEEVVVTALGITREERSLGYSVQGIDGDELVEVRDNNIISNQAGKVAGLDGLAAFGDPRLAARQAPEVVEPGAPDLAAPGDLDRLDSGRVHQEGALHADALGHSANGEV